ncbi:protein of unknown function [Methylococcus capsulatus]|uniref:Transposase n=1 Tax=Methylococcus capsulatus TaxID=414 RepID=A0AA35UST1_METCP|nr:protein of unknown function [Methylococcus capsulatus]
MALQESHGLSGDALDARCREHGVFVHRLAEWKADFCGPSEPAERWSRRQRPVPVAALRATPQTDGGRAADPGCQGFNGSPLRWGLARHSPARRTASSRTSAEYFHGFLHGAILSRRGASSKPGAVHARLHRPLIRAWLRVGGKHSQRKYDYPPDLQDSAVQTVLQ